MNSAVTTSHSSTNKSSKTTRFTRLTTSIVTAFLALIAVLGLAGCGNIQQQSQNTGQQNTAFAEFVKETVLESFSESYLSTHVYWLDPTAYGFDETTIEVGWGATYSELYTEEALTQTVEEYEEVLQELDAFDRNQLSGQAQSLYDWLKFTWEREQTLYSPTYAYYPQAFAYNTDDISNIVTLLLTWRLDDEQDIQDLITLIEDTDNYLAGQLEYTREQADRGLLRAHVESTTEMATTVIEEGTDGTLIHTLENLIDETSSQIGLTETTTNQYKQQLTQAYENSLLVGFQNVIDTLEELETAGKIVQTPLTESPNGVEYYNLLIQTKTGIDTTAEELETELWDALENTIKTYYQTAINNYNLIDISYTFTLNLDSYETELNLLADAAKTDFPDIGELNYQIETLDASLIGSSTAAFFMSGAIDDPNPIYQMRVGNSGSDLTNPNNALTVAHEGIPGHMYQYAYCLQNAEIIEGCIIGNTGYKEGYAQYVESVATTYFTSEQTNEEVTSSEVQTIMQLNDLESHMAFYVSALYEITYTRGKDLSELTTQLAELGLSYDSEVEDTISEIAASNPMLYTVYAAGLDQFETLREHAETELADNFNSLEFHQTVLDTGPTSFANLTEAVETYIAENQ